MRTTVLCEACRRGPDDGTPGLARAQQLAALALGDRARQQAAEDALARCLADPVQLARISDPALCHGWAGLLLTAKVVTDQKTALRFDDWTWLVALMTVLIGIAVVVLHWWWLFRYVTPAHASDRHQASQYFHPAPQSTKKPHDTTRPASVRSFKYILPVEILPPRSG